MESSAGNNLSRVKVANQAAIRRIIYEYGPITRSAIAKRLSLTLPTITTNISAMISLGILEDVPLKGDIPQAVGRRANAVNIVPDSRYFIGVEIHKLSRHLCVTDFRGTVLYQREDDRPFPDYDECVANACSLLKEALASFPAPPEKIGGIGVCLAGIIDPDTGILGAHRQNNWYHKHVQDDIRRLTGYSGPVQVENNTLARAYGAQLFRKDLLHDVPSFTYFYIYTGIACPLILNSPTMFSRPVGPGEIGYMILEPHQPRNELGNMGTLHNFAGEKAILKRCHEALSQGRAPILKALTENTPLSFSQALKAQELGDSDVDQIMKEAAFYLGIAAANMDNLIRPHSCIIEGRIFSNPQNREHFLTAIQENQFRLTDTETHFLFIDFDDFSGAKGAAAIAIRNHLETYIPFPS